MVDPVYNCIHQEVDAEAILENASVVVAGNLITAALTVLDAESERLLQCRPITVRLPVDLDIGGKR